MINYTLHTSTIQSSCIQLHNINRHITRNIKLLHSQFLFSYKLNYFDFCINQNPLSSACIKINQFSKKKSNPHMFPWLHLLRFQQFEKNLSK